MTNHLHDAALHDLMTTASARVDTPSIDLAAITEAGERRVRRRRATVGAAIACTTALAVAVGPTLLPGESPAQESAFAAA
ncbi:MAG: hypothetical protein ACI39M_18435, partial [Streptomyces albidoflavus]